MTNYPSIAKFADLVQLKDYRPPTKKEYVRYLLRFADHLQRDPAGATEDDLRPNSFIQSDDATIIADAKTETERFAKEARAQLRAQIARRAQMAKDKIEQAEAAALTEIRALAADTATAAAEKLIAARLDEKRSAALVEASIKELPDKLN